MPFDIAGNGRCVQSIPGKRGSRQATYVSSNVDKHDRYTKRVADGRRKAGVEKRTQDFSGMGDARPLLDENSRDHQGEGGSPRGLGPQQK
jgi:hypothetical protein